MNEEVGAMAMTLTGVRLLVTHSTPSLLRVTVDGRLILLKFLPSIVLRRKGSAKVAMSVELAIVSAAPATEGSVTIGSVMLNFGGMLNIIWGAVPPLSV